MFFKEITMNKICKIILIALFICIFIYGFYIIIKDATKSDWFVITLYLIFFNYYDIFAKYLFNSISFFVKFYLI